MTTTLYATGNSGHLQSSNATYAVARAGGTLSAVAASSATGQIAGFFIYEAFVEFDCSALAGESIDSAELAVWGSLDQSVQDFVIEARVLDYGPSLTTADWVPGADLAALDTVRATYDTAGGWTGVYNVFTSVSLAAAVQAAAGGTLRLILHSARTRTGDAPVPGDQERVLSDHASGLPRLVVEHHTGVEEHEGEVHDSATVEESAAGIKSAITTISDGTTADTAVTGVRSAFGGVSDGATVGDAIIAFRGAFAAITDGAVLDSSALGSRTATVTIVDGAVVADTVSSGSSPVLSGSTATVTPQPQPTASLVPGLVVAASLTPHLVPEAALTPAPVATATVSVTHRPEATLP